MTEEQEQNLVTAARTIRRIQLLTPLMQRLRAQHGGTNWSGAAKCPICGGIMQLRTVSGGVIAGQCETQECVNFLE